MAEIPHQRPRKPARCVRPLGAGTCGSAVPADAPVPMCMTHLAEAWEYCGDKIAQSRVDTHAADSDERGAKFLSLLSESRAEQLAAIKDAQDWLEEPEVDDPNAVVYYVRFADRIKIGYTGNLGRRLTAIPHDELLTVEPGARQVEANRHRQFAEHRIVGEWFAAAPALLEHVDSLKARHAEREKWREKAVEAFDLVYPPRQMRTDAEVLDRLK